LKDFAMTTLETEYGRLKEINDLTQSALEEQKKIVDSMNKAMKRNDSLRPQVQEKLDAYTSEVEALSKKRDAQDKIKKDREGKLAKVEEPIKKLLDEKLAMQKKLS